MNPHPLVQKIGLRTSLPIRAEQPACCKSAAIFVFSPTRAVGRFETRQRRKIPAVLETAVTRQVVLRVPAERAFAAFVDLSDVLAWLADGAVIWAGRKDDDVEVARASGGDSGSGHAVWETEKLHVASGWTDASHVGWFRSLFDQFADAILHHDFVSHETESSVRCVELITNAYASALDASRERTLPSASLVRVA